MNKVIIVKCELDTLNTFSLRLGEGFEELGYQVFYLDTEKSLDMASLKGFLSSPVAACIGFNNSLLRYDGTPIGDIIFEQYGVSKINILVDNPIYFTEELLTHKNDVVITIDEEHMQYVQQNFANVPVASFMPHGGTRLLEYAQQKPIRDRSIDVFYAGTIHVYKGGLELEDLRPSISYPFDYELFKSRLWTMLNTNIKQGLVPCTDLLLAQMGCELDLTSRVILYLNLVRVERLVCSRYREELIRQIANAGIRLTLCGDNWDKYPEITSLPNVNFLGHITSGKVLELMQDSRIVLNHMTWFKKGSHERLFNGMLGGSVVLSDNNRFIEKELIAQSILSQNELPDAQLFTYELGHEACVPEFIKGLLANSELMDRVAHNGYRTACDKHTWKRRAAQLATDFIERRTSKHYNIMTSSDDKLLGQLEILLFSIDKNLTDAEVNFYYFHRGIAADKLARLYEFAAQLARVTLHDIVVNDIDKYDYIASYGGGWAGEAYYSLCAHEYLPSDVDRVLYLDAGDVIVVGDFDRFYNADFEDNVILASNIRLYIEGEPVIFENEEDLQDENKMLQILDSTFNSGSYMLNLRKLRAAGLTIDDYVGFTNMFLPLADVLPRLYFGDQGFLSACFLGDIKYFDYPMNKNLISTAYNFTMGWYNIYDAEPDFVPAIIHYAGEVKPWLVEYSRPHTNFEYTKEKTLQELKPGHIRWYELWSEYARLVEGMRCSLSD